MKKLIILIMVCMFLLTGCGEDPKKEKENDSGFKEINVIPIDVVPIDVKGI